jgi:hypothetical protein
MDVVYNSVTQQILHMGVVVFHCAWSKFQNDCQMSVIGPPPFLALALDVARPALLRSTIPFRANSEILHSILHCI